MREIDEMAVQAANDTDKLEEFVRGYEPFILKCASKTSKRFISKEDDEWSIALSAFYDAIISYDMDKGAFISFSELIIKRRLIDYFRSQGKYLAEVNVDYIEDMEDESDHLSDLKYEISSISDRLNDYNFSFMDVSGQSPKAIKTKEACREIVRYIIENPLVLNQLKDTKTLQIKLLEKKLDLPRKTIERHRKYIIAAVEIIVGDYPYLKEYLRYIWED